MATVRLTAHSTPAEPGTDEQAERETEIMHAVERVSPNRHYANGECLMTWSYWNQTVRDATRLGVAVQNLLRLDHVDRVEIR